MFIVTGGAGFIGSAMIWQLNQRGITDILVVDNLASTEKWKNLVALQYSDYIHRDRFIEYLKADSFSSPVDAIFHMGACSSTTELNADFLINNNLEYSKALCLFAQKKNIPFITASSAATYGDGSKGFDDSIDIKTLRPLNMYGYSKHLFDLWADKMGFFNSITSVKFFNVYGPNEYHKGSMRSVVNKSYEQILRNGKVSLFKSTDPAYPDGGQMRDFVYVKDCVAIMWKIFESKTSGSKHKVNGLFNIGTGKARTWLDLVQAVSHAMNKQVDIEFIPIPEELQGKYQNFTQASSLKLSQALPSPHLFSSLEEGIQDYVQNYLMQDYPFLSC